MEDYGKAFDSRRADVNKLLTNDNPRTTAAAHLGGVAVECKLKALVVKYHGISVWGESSSRPKDPRRGQPIERPGHGLVGSLRLMQELYSKASSDRNFMTHLSRIMHPSGPTELDFIDLRYSGHDLEGNTLGDWHKSLNYVLSWLEKNGEK